LLFCWCGLAVIISPSPTFFEISPFTTDNFQKNFIKASISFHSIVYKSFVLLHGNLNQPIYPQLSTKQQNSSQNSTIFFTQKRIFRLFRIKSDITNELLFRLITT
jgi:hypothetical protein